jgi:ribonuclease VapC
MIVVHTSALMTIVARESAAASCIQVLSSETSVLVSAGTLAEALIVAGRRRAAQSRLSFGGRIR